MLIHSLFGIAENVNVFPYFKKFSIFSLTKQRVKPVILYIFFFWLRNLAFFFYSAKGNSSSTKNHFALFYRLFISEPHRAKWNENLTLIKCNDWTAKDKSLKSSEKYQSESQRKRGHNGRIEYISRVKGEASPVQSELTQQENSEYLFCQQTPWLMLTRIPRRWPNSVKFFFFWFFWVCLFNTN